MSFNIKTNNTIKTTTEASDISNPNLLINPNFAINQRAGGAYIVSSISEYTVDRWKLWNGTLIKNDDGTITVKSSTDCSLVQILEDECTEECCASIYVTKISGYWTLYTESDNIYDGSITLKEGLNTVKFTGCKTFAIATHGKNNDSITIKYVKLEKGSNATRFIEPNPATELLKCQRYYIKYHQVTFIPGKLYVSNLSQSAGAYTPLTRHLPIKMRVNPSARCSSMTANNGGNAGVSFSLEADSTEIKAVILNNNVTTNYYLISINDLELNAEIY